MNEQQINKIEAITQSLIHPQNLFFENHGL